MNPATASEDGQSYSTKRASFYASVTAEQLSTSGGAICKAVKASPADVPDGQPMRGGKDATKIVLTALIPIASNQNGFAGCDHDKRFSLPEMRRIQLYHRFQADYKRIRQKAAKMPEMRF